MTVDLPTLDFHQFLGGTQTERQEVADQLITSFTQHGFVKLINHGVPDEMVNGIWEWSKKFFSLTVEQKSKLENLPGPRPQRGWSKKGSERPPKFQGNFVNHSPNAEILDEKEHFDCGPPNDGEFSNLWPDPADLPGYKEFIEKYFVVAQATCLDIMSACEVGLRIPSGTLVDMCKPAASELRVLYYPEVSIETLKTGLIKRAWPHTDFGIITLLFQDGLGGLEMEDRSKPFTFVPVMTKKRNEMVVNISDTFGRWSNGSIQPGLHQVNVPPSLLCATEGVVPERYSSVFFFKADRRASVGPLAPFVGDETPAKYPDITALEFQNQSTEALYY